jgi:hypothetical protein
MRTGKLQTDSAVKEPAPALVTVVACWLALVVRVLMNDSRDALKRTTQSAKDAIPGVGVQGDRAQIILLWALLLAARRSSGRLPAVIGCPAPRW